MDNVENERYKNINDLNFDYIRFAWNCTGLLELLQMYSLRGNLYTTHNVSFSHSVAFSISTYIIVLRILSIALVFLVSHPFRFRALNTYTSHFCVFVVIQAFIASIFIHQHKFTILNVFIYDHTRYKTKRNKTKTKTGHLFCLSFNFLMILMLIKYLMAQNRIGSDRMSCFCLYYYYGRSLMYLCEYVSCLRLTTLSVIHFRTERNKNREPTENIFSRAFLFMV